MVPLVTANPNHFKPRRCHAFHPTRDVGITDGHFGERVQEEACEPLLLPDARVRFLLSRPSGHLLPRNLSERPANLSSVCRLASHTPSRTADEHQFSDRIAQASPRAGGISQKVNSDNVNRQNVKRLISLFPGVHLRMLSRYLGASLSTTRYHLGNLEKDGEVLCRKEGEYLRAYPLWAGDERSRRIYAIIQQKGVRKLLGAMLREPQSEEPRLSNSRISAIAQLSQSTVSEYLAMLRDLQLVRKLINRDGHITFEIPEGDRQRLSTILALYDGSFLSKATDSYVSLWEF
jgi:DNA-binding transcriptional ArsR family regulator